MGTNSDKIFLETFSRYGSTVSCLKLQLLQTSKLNLITVLAESLYCCKDILNNFIFYSTTQQLFISECLQMRPGRVVLLMVTMFTLPPQDKSVVKGLSINDIRSYKRLLIVD